MRIALRQARLEERAGCAERREPRGVVEQTGRDGGLQLGAEAAELLGEARPAALDDDTLTIEFAAGADFHRRQAEEQKNVALLRDALYEVTGRRLAVATALADDDEQPAGADDEPLSEEDVISLLKDTFDAEEVEG